MVGQKAAEAALRGAPIFAPGRSAVSAAHRVEAILASLKLHWLFPHYIKSLKKEFTSDLMLLDVMAYQK